MRGYVQQEICRLVALRNITACGVCKFDKGLGLNALRPHFQVRAQAKYCFLSKKGHVQSQLGGCQKVSPIINFQMKYFLPRKVRSSPGSLASIPCD